MEEMSLSTPFIPPQSQRRGYFMRNDEACPMKLNSRAAKPLIRLQRGCSRNIHANPQIREDASRPLFKHHRRAFRSRVSLADHAVEVPLVFSTLAYRHRDTNSGTASGCRFVRR